MGIESIDPSTGEVVQRYEVMEVEEVGRIIEEGDRAFEEWGKVGFRERAALFGKVAGILRERGQEYAELMAREMGKPIKGGISEIEKCAWCCEYYAEHAETFLAPETVMSEASKSYVTFQPLGVVLAIMPWNFPFWQVFRFAAPNLMAGNVGLLKHASNTTGCALAIEEIFTLAGFPKNVFRSLITTNEIVDECIAHPKIAAVTLTGSTEAGKIVAAKAGAYVKKVVLELGGSDPYIILEDADLNQAVESCVASRLTNSGQSCIAAKRFIVVEKVREQFEELFVKRMKEARMGDPKKEQTQIGPQARADLRDHLHQQVQDSIQKGARCLLGGVIPKPPGFYYPPTVLAGVIKGMPAYDEELFGPVAAIISVRSEAEAVSVANDTIYGLGAAVFTANTDKGEAIALQLKAGNCFVNSLVRSDPRMPFGGVKGSGYGRELSHFGIREFVNTKTVVID